MKTEKFKDVSKDGMSIPACFYYSFSAMAPQYPSGVDVLYVLGKTQDDKYYKMCERNNKPYIDNVNFVANIVGFEIAALVPYDEAKARKIIARAIIDFSPEKARCLFNPDFVEAKIVLDEKVPPKDTNVHERRRACLCQECRTSSSTD